MKYFKYNKLRGRIIEKMGSTNAFIEKMEMSKATYYARLNDKIPFTQDEITKICELLEIPVTDIHLYFFSKLD